VSDPVTDAGSGGLQVLPVEPRDAEVGRLLEALTAELAEGGYSDEETFGYSVEQLEAGGVHLVGAYAGDVLVGVGGVELQDGGAAELKRFYVRPAHRGSGAADAIITTLVAYAHDAGRRVVRLETGDKQHAAIRFYARHGFEHIDRFGPYVHSATSVCMARTIH